jgi:hypothetical protein
MVNKAKVEPKTIQGILRHAKIQTTLDLYTQEDGDENTGGARGISHGAGSGYTSWCSEVSAVWVGLWVEVFGYTR